ncbi:MAG: hypothetical protein IJA23_00260, partial [Clostridia bacterium]|nr:hypothetical protein [Clostridia bacterium]
ADGDEISSVAQVVTGQSVILVSNTAYAKKVNVSEIDILARYRKGVKVFDLKGNATSGTSIIGSGVFGEDDDVVIQTDEDEYSAISVSSIQEDTRSGRGKSLSVENKQIKYALIRHNN